MIDIEKGAVELAENLIQFIDESPTSFHAGQSIMDNLIECGFTKLDPSKSWTLEPGKGYFTEHNYSAVIAFRIGNKPATESGFNIVGAHTDSPSLKLKVSSEQITKGCAKIGVEVYGSPIINTWLDRNLAIAGKVMVKKGSSYISKLVNISEPIAMIPNLAIHLNRDVNKGIELNKQTHLPVILGCVASEENEILKGLISAELNVDSELIGEMDLFLYDFNGGELCGLDDALITAARIDNLAMCHAVVTSLCDSDQGDATAVGVFFDHEEVGSRSSQGADSNLLKNVLKRIVMVQDDDRQAYFRAVAHSFMISADGAHAVHPNYVEKHDSSYAPEINGGPVIKLNANMRYTTTAESANKFIELCELTNVPFQKMTNRSDMACGSTIGPVCSATLGIPSVDVGTPMWAMHSIRETTGVYDHYYMTEVLKTFYSI